MAARWIGRPAFVQVKRHTGTTEQRWDTKIGDRRDIGSRLIGRVSTQARATIGITLSPRSPQRAPQGSPRPSSWKA
jgi:hypothetical protein